MKGGRSLMFAILGLSCCFLRAMAADDADRLRVMTYNIHHGEGQDGKLDLDRIVRIIRAANPDVVCLQEVDRRLPRTNRLDFPSEFAKRLEMSAVFECNYAFEGGEYGNATLTRLEILSHENIALPNPDPAAIEPRGCLKTVVRTQAGPIAIFNAHLGLKSGERNAQAKALLTHIGTIPAILAGDWNEGVEKSGVSLLLARFKDALTLGGVPSTQDGRARIDHIFVSGLFDVAAARIVSTAETPVASDHLPFVVELRLPVSDGVPEKEGIYDTDDDRVVDALR